MEKVTEGLSSCITELLSDGLSSSSDVHTHVLERRQELRLDNHCSGGDGMAGWH